MKRAFWILLRMLLKKYTAILLTLLMLVSSTGFAFNVHYCGGSVASVSLKPESVKTDKDCCSMKSEKSGCCKSKIVHFQKKSENTLAKIFAFQAETVAPLDYANPFFPAIVSNFQSDTRTSYYCDANAPPLFKLYSQYIFYDEV